VLLVPQVTPAPQVIPTLQVTQEQPAAVPEPQMTQETLAGAPELQVTAEPLELKLKNSDKNLIFSSCS
jgi:hypothetical protein